MLYALRLALISSAIALPVIFQSSTPVSAQERQGCFMISQAGQLIDLSPLCPAVQPFAVPTAQAQTPLTLGTGDIQVTLRWTTLDDVDLAVTDPAGDVLAYYNRAVASQGQLDVDANAGCSEQNTSPIENVFWPAGQAPQGQYSIQVSLFTRCGGSTAPIPFNLTVLVQGTTRTIQGTVSDQQPTATFPFSLPTQP